MHTLIIRRLMMGSWGLISDVDHKALWDFPTNDDEDDELSERTAPDFTCSLTHHKYHFHTHAPAACIVYYLGKYALKGNGPTQKSLTDLAASHWNAVSFPR